MNGILAGTRSVDVSGSSAPSRRWNNFMHIEAPKNEIPKCLTAIGFREMP